jgi:hypothetical protein
MNVMIAAKRLLFAFLTVAGLALYALGAAETQPCPLPATFSQESSQDQSPEQEKCLRLVRHNGMPLCVPCPAADAHMRHGDADLGTCTKPGNQK